MEKFKKLTAIVLTVLMLISAIPVVSFAAEIIDSGTCGDNLTWTLDEDGTLTISGEGEMTSSPWNKEDVKTVIIEEGVTNIVYSAFSDCSSLTSVMIGDSVTSIGYSAFSDCSALTSVTIPGGVTSIVRNAFTNCSALTSVTIPDSVTSIGRSAFSNCSSLADVYYTGTIEEWKSISIDSNNYKLTGANLWINGRQSGTCGDNLTWTLDEDGTLTISGTGSMMSYRSSPWENMNVCTVIIEEGVTSIGGYAFYCCYSLSAITIPDSVTSIGDSAFRNCSALTDVYYSGPLDEWNSISIGSNNDKLISAGVWIDGKRIGLCGDNLTWTLDADGTLTISGTGAMKDYSSWGDYRAPWHNKDVKSVVIEDGVTSIGGYAFYDCSSLTSVMIGDSVTSIGNYAFEDCRSLASIVIPDSTTSIGSYAFRSCSSLTSVTIPDSVTSIGGYAFYDCSSLTSVTIGDSVTSIGNYAFEDCRSLTSVTIPDSVTSIGIGAFYNCSSLKDVYYTGSVESWGNINISYSNEELTNNGINIGGKLCRFCGKSVIWTLDEYGTLTVSGTGEMTSSPWNKSDVKAVTIEEGVTCIGNLAFYECRSLTSVTIPDSVTIIGWGAFFGCSLLTSVTIPDSVTSIDESVFKGCSSLNDIYYSGTVEAFLSFAPICLAEKTLHASDGDIVIKLYCGDNVTWNLREDGTLTVSGKGDMYNYSAEGSTTAPWYDETVTTVIIEDGVTSIGNYAFYVFKYEYDLMGYPYDVGSSITSVSIPSSVISIGDHAFDRCSLLSNVYYGGTFEEWNSISVGTANDNLINAVLWINGKTGGTCGDNLTWILDIEGTLTISGTGEMTSNPWKISRNMIQTIIIDDGVTSIGDWAFEDCSSLTSVTIPDSVTSIGEGAFEDCRALTSVTIHDSVTNIGNWAFFDCNSLTSVTIPDSVTSISDYTFGKCSSLTSITIPDSVTSIGEGAFRDCSSLNDIYYTGTEEEWSNISIASYGNNALKDATIHFNTVIVPQYAPGDIDGNRMINTKDSNLLKQVILGKYSVTGKAFDAADLSCDGRINTKDSFMLKKMLAAG